MSYGLRNLAQTRAGGIEPVVDAVNALLEGVVQRYNSEVGPRLFGRLTSEPSSKKSRLAFRSRIGLLIEASFGFIIDEMVRADQGLIFSFNVNQEYPDFLLRDVDRTILLRIDFKSLHDESEEFSARFKTPMSDIRAMDDLIVYVAWRWREREIGGRSISFPMVMEAFAIPAIQVAEERDYRQLDVGGKFDVDGRPLVPAKRQKDGSPPSSPWSPDTNFGKVNRIIARRRRREDLSPYMQRFADFVQRYITARTGSDESPAEEEGETSF